MREDRPAGRNRPGGTARAEGSSKAEEPGDAAMMRPARRAVLAGALGSALVGAVGAGLALRHPSRSGLRVPDLLRARPFYVAHRGGSSDWPECSLLAYRESVARGVDALEI